MFNAIITVHTRIRKIRTNSLVLPALLSGAAAGNRAHRYIGNFCCLLLVQADYIVRAPGRGPEGTGNCSSCYEYSALILIFSPQDGQRKRPWPKNLCRTAQACCWYTKITSLSTSWYVLHVLASSRALPVFVEVSLQFREDSE